MNDRGGGREKVSNFYVEFFLSHSAEKNRKGTLSVSLVSGTKKKFWLRSLGHCFLSKFYRLTVPQKIHK